jgi:hypothetical protein
MPGPEQTNPGEPTPQTAYPAKHCTADSALIVTGMGVEPNDKPLLLTLFRDQLCSSQRRTGARLNLLHLCGKHAKPSSRRFDTSGDSAAQAHPTPYSRSRPLSTRYIRSTCATQSGCELQKTKKKKTVEVGQPRDSWPSHLTVRKPFWTPPRSMLAHRSPVTSESTVNFLRASSQRGQSQTSFSNDCPMRSSHRLATFVTPREGHASRIPGKEPEKQARFGGPFRTPSVQAFRLEYLRRCFHLSRDQ